MKLGYVYHIQHPEYIGDINFGYIGVTNKNKGVFKRFREHLLGESHMRHKMQKYNVTYSNVRILYEGPLEECYRLEEELRPQQLIGWNLAKGGYGSKYIGITNLSEHRSKIQTERMKDNKLKKKQGESFKRNYYNNKSSIELRIKRAKEHMSNLEKKQKCLNAMHKKIKCPHCDFESNTGNVKQHLKRKHQ